MAEVGALPQRHPPIAAQAPGRLAVAHIHAIHAGSAPLQQAIGETAGGDPPIHADPPGDGNRECVQRGFQLLAAAGHIARGLLHLQIQAGQHIQSWLVQHPVAAADTTGPDQLLGLLAAARQPSFHQHQVEALLAGHGCDHSIQQLEQSPRKRGASAQPPEDCCIARRFPPARCHGPARFPPCPALCSPRNCCGVAAARQFRAPAQSTRRPAPLPADPVPRRPLLGTPAGLGMPGAMGSGPPAPHQRRLLTPQQAPPA